MKRGIAILLLAIFAVVGVVSCTNTSVNEELEQFEKLNEKRKNEARRPGGNS